METDMERAELRCVETTSGAPSVTKDGTTSMPLWLAEHSDSSGVSVTELEIISGLLFSAHNQVEWLLVEVCILLDQAQFLPLV